MLSILYDLFDNEWLHSGHVRFFEEASSLGDLYEVVGHDANIKLLMHKEFKQSILGP